MYQQPLGKKFWVAAGQKFDCVFAPRKSHTRQTDKMTSVITPENFNANLLSVSAIRQNEKTGAKSAYVNYNGGKVLIQTAVEMRSPYGLNKFDQGEKASNPDYSIDVSFDGYDVAGHMKGYYEMIQGFDTFIKAEALKNQKAWFKTNYSKEVLDAFYNPTVKVAKDKDGNPKPYAPTQKLKLNVSGAPERRTKFYDVDGRPLNESVDRLLARGATLTAIVECGGIWFAGGKFGLTWRATQIIVHSVPQAVGDFAFVGFKKAPGSAVQHNEVAAVADEASNHVDDEEEERFLSAPAPVAPVATPVADEEADGEEVEPAPVPKKTIVTKKKVVVAKK